MTEPQNNNQQIDNSSLLIASFWQFLVEKTTTKITKIIVVPLIIGVFLLTIKYQGNLVSLFDFNITDPAIFIPLSASTGLVVLMTTLLSTPVSVAFAVGIIIYLVCNQLL